MLTKTIKLEVWRDARMDDARFRVCQRELGSDIPENATDGTWTVRAEFMYATELITYLKRLNLSFDF